MENYTVAQTETYKLKASTLPEAVYRVEAESSDMCLSITTALNVFWKATPG